MNGRVKWVLRHAEVPGYQSMLAVDDCLDCVVFCSGGGLLYVLTWSIKPVESCLVSSDLYWYTSGPCGQSCVTKKKKEFVGENHDVEQIGLPPKYSFDACLRQS